MTRDVTDKRVTGQSSTNSLRCHLRLTAPVEKSGSPVLPPGSPYTQIIAVENEFPVLRTTALLALQLLFDPTLTVARLGSVVETDLSLEAEIVRLANSSIYAVRHPITVLGQVPARLGFDKCQQLIEIASLSLMLKSIPLSDTSLRQKLWFHGFLTGTICSELNQLLQLGGNGEEFRCGLIHDVGRLLLAAAAPAQFDSLDFNESSELLARERETIGSDHCEVGAWFAGRKGMQETIVAAVQHHHAPELAGKHRLMVGLVAMADHMAHHLQEHDTGAGYTVESNPALHLMFRNDAHRRCLFLTSAIPLMNKSLRSARLVAMI